MDDMTRQNAALVEENTAAAQSLVSQASEFKNIMKFFTVGDEGESQYHSEPQVAHQQTETVKEAPVMAAATSSPAPSSSASTSSERVIGDDVGGNNESKEMVDYTGDDDWEEF